MLLHVKNAFFYSLDGLIATFNEEMAFKIVLLQATMFCVLMVTLPFTYMQQAFLLLSIALTLIVELINTALENIVDLITTDWHISAKKAKDMGSAAQLVASISLYVQLVIMFF